MKPKIIKQKQTFNNKMTKISGYKCKKLKKKNGQLN